MLQPVQPSSSTAKKAANQRLFPAKPFMRSPAFPLCVSNLYNYKPQGSICQRVRQWKHYNLSAISDWGDIDFFIEKQYNMAKAAPSAAGLFIRGNENEAYREERPEPFY